MSNNSVKSGNAYDLGDINEGVTSGAKKAAVLLMTLGTELSSEILKNLSDKQVQKIGVEIANLHKVTAEERRKILREFLEARKSKDFAMQGGIDYAKSLFQGAFDGDFHFNASLAAVNLAKAACKRLGITYSISSCKSFIHNAYIDRKSVV